MKLNETLGGNDVPESDLRFIGFLDIFGFDNFTYNTFEQLCINFTNERLQSHFTDALIKRQQEDYKREGVTCAHINFPDNALQIQLIDGNKGSVYSMLDEECLVPKARRPSARHRLPRLRSGPRLHLAGCPRVSHRAPALSPLSPRARTRATLAR